MNPEFLKRLDKIEKEIKEATELTENWKKKSFGVLPEGSCPSYCPELYLNCLLEPNSKLIGMGGKRWRPLFATLIADLVSGNKDSNLVYKLAPVVEFVHTASLIHDDIEDGADLRRGHPCAHIAYGLDTALNAGSWFYFEALALIDALEIEDGKKLALHKMTGQELRRLHLGQAMYICLHRHVNVFPSEKEYEAMVRQKTGTLANLAAQLGALASGADEELSNELGQTASSVGMGFQIIDDVINLTTGNVGKKRGDDIVEGKKSLPVLIHVKNHPENKEKISELMEEAGKEGIESAAVEKCIKLLETDGCIEEARKKGVSVIKQTCEQFRNLGLKKCGKDSIKAADLIEELFTSMIPN